MSEELVIRHCSPTLAGLKTANMFACQFESKEELRDELSSLNKILINKGLRALPLKYENKRALIYIYRPAELKCDLQCSKACKVLENCGYNCKSPERCIAQLMSRLKENNRLKALLKSVLVNLQDFGKSTAIPKKQRNFLRVSENA